MPYEYLVVVDSRNESPVSELNGEIQFTADAANVVLTRELPADAARVFYRYFPDDRDFLYLCMRGTSGGTSWVLRNDIQGIGLDRSDTGAAYGSGSRLQNVIFFGLTTETPPTARDHASLGGVPIRPLFDPARQFGGHWGYSGANGILGRVLELRQISEERTGGRYYVGHQQLRMDGPPTAFPTRNWICSTWPVCDLSRRGPSQSFGGWLTTARFPERFGPVGSIGSGPTRSMPGTAGASRPGVRAESKELHRRCCGDFEESFKRSEPGICWASWRGSWRSPTSGPPIPSGSPRPPAELPR